MVVYERMVRFGEREKICLGDASGFPDNLAELQMPPDVLIDGSQTVHQSCAQKDEE